MLSSGITRHLIQAESVTTCDEAEALILGCSIERGDILVLERSKVYNLEQAIEEYKHQLCQ